MHISEAAKVSFARLLPSAFTSEDFPEPQTPTLLDTGLSWDHSTKRRLLYTDYEHLLYTDLNCCYQLLCYTLDVCNPQDRPATRSRCIYYNHQVKIKGMGACTVLYTRPQEWYLSSSRPELQLIV